VIVSALAEKRAVPKKRLAIRLRTEVFILFRFDF
jgi:hypothetical protein